MRLLLILAVTFVTHVGVTASAQTCEPRCRMGSTCVSGTCVPDRPSAVCEPRCRMGQVCVDGTCRLEGAACQPACGPNETCRGGTCEPAACVPACGPGMTCAAGRCEVPPDPACVPACGEGQACVEGSCQALFVDPCSVCPAAHSCVDGVCVNDSRDCPVDQTYDPAAGCMPDPTSCQGADCGDPFIVEEACGGACGDGEMCVQNACVSAPASWEDDPGLNFRLHLSLGGTYGWWAGVSFAGQAALGGGGQYGVLGFRISGGKGDNVSTDSAGSVFSSLEAGWRHMRGRAGAGLTLAALVGYGRVFENNPDGNARYRVPYLRLAVGVLGTQDRRLAFGAELSASLGYMKNYERDEIVGRLGVVRNDLVDTAYGDVTLSLVLTL